MKTRAALSLLMGVLGMVRVGYGELKTDVEYGKVGETSLKLDLCVPDGGTEGKFPIVVIVHGGGWSGGDKTKDITPLFEPLTQGRFVWVSINYRLAPADRWPACLEDVKTAMRWVKAHAAEYKGDPEKIVLAGHSAGGHLAFLAAIELAGTPEAPTAVLGLAPVTDMEGDLPTRGGLSPSLQGLLNRPKEVDDQTLKLLREIQPVRRVKAGFPPCLIIQGSADKTVRPQDSQAFVEKVKAIGGKADLISVQGGQHRVTEWDGKDGGAWKGGVVTWLNEHLGRPGAATRPSP